MCFGENLRDLYILQKNPILKEGYLLNQNKDNALLRDSKCHFLYQKILSSPNSTGYGML